MVKARSEMKAQLGALAARRRMTTAQFVQKRGLKTPEALINWCNSNDVELPHADQLAQLFDSTPASASKPAVAPEKKVSKKPARKKKKATAAAEADVEPAEESSTGSTRM